MIDDIYDRVGGEAFFTALVDDFYAQVATDEVLRPMYPEEDLGGANERLRLYLMERCGGPATYSAERGHPRLRMRHLPFEIDEAARDHWMAAMTHALEQRNLSPEDHDAMLRFFVPMAQHMINKG